MFGSVDRDPLLGAELHIVVRAESHAWHQPRVLADNYSGLDQNLLFKGHDRQHCPAIVTVAVCHVRLMRGNGRR